LRFSQGKTRRLCVTGRMRAYPEFPGRKRARVTRPSDKTEKYRWCRDSGFGGASYTSPFWGECEHAPLRDSSNLPGQEPKSPRTDFHYYPFCDLVTVRVTPGRQLYLAAI
jgi:hypothetical protein